MASDDEPDQRIVDLAVHIATIVRSGRGQVGTTVTQDVYDLLHASLRDARAEGRLEMRDEAADACDDMSKDQSNLATTMLGPDGAMCCARAWTAETLAKRIRALPITTQATPGTDAREETTCTCGSGLHPRRCQAHAERYREHCDEISAENADAREETSKP